MAHQTLTALEIQVLKAWPANYDDAESEKSDNATWTGVRELSSGTGLDLTTVKGVVGSLAKKQLCLNDGGELVLSDAGIDQKFSI